MEIVDIAEANVDIEAVIFLPIVGPKDVRFIGLRGDPVARDLNQP